jgi:phage terminase small subunit
MTRGRQSNARNRLAVVPPPPDTLSDDQAQVWRDTCESQNAEWLDTGPGPLLEDYCAAVVKVRKLRNLIRLEEANPDNKGLASLDLEERKEKASQAMQRLARALRLTPQSRIRADKSGNDQGKPWEQSTNDGDDDDDGDQD